MDGILSIFQGIANTEDEHLDVYLKAINEHQSFRLKVSNSSDPVVQHITSVLSKPATRFEGLQLLNSYLQQCPIEVLEQKGVLWMTLALKSCNSREAENVGNLVYVVLKTLAKKSVEIPDISKAFTSNFLHKIYDSLSTTIPCAYHSALECVETCLRLYPGPSGQSRSSVEKFLLRFTDVTDESIVLWSGKCLHLLQQVRGGGVQGTSHKAAWQNYQMKLLGSLHSVLDSAFANCTEVYDDTVEKEQLNIVDLQLSDEPVKRAMQLYFRFRNLVKYLVTALQQPFPVSKAVAPKKILNLIARGLSVTCPMLEKNKIFDNLAIGALLPKMHTFMFELLEATIKTLKSNLAMYHSMILGFVFDTLKWTSSKKSTGQQKPYSMLRSAAYKALTLWCHTLKHGSRCEIVAEGILEEIVFDISPFENAFTLKVLSGAKKHMSKKARRQLHKAQNEQSNLAQTHSNPSDSQAKKQIFSDHGNQNLCIAALQCLRSVMLSAGCFLKPTVVKSTHLKIISICLLLSDVTPKSDQLYGSYRCRFEAYHALQSLILAPHHLCPPPTQMTVKLLQMAQIRDSSAVVREACSMFLSSLEKIIHPQKESLIFPPDIREIRNAFHKVGKERLLAGVLDLVVNDDEEDDQSSDEEEAAFSDEEMAVLEIEANKTPELIETTTDQPSSIDLTLDDSRMRDPIHLDSSNDSVEYIPEAQSNGQAKPTQRLLVEEVMELPKSPEMTLRVEEDDEDELSQEELQKEETPIAQPEKLSTEFVSVENNNQEEDAPTSPKRPRIEESEPATNSTSAEKQAGVDEESDINGTSFEEIAASFVDELN